MNAVITSDIIDYTKLSVEGEDLVLKTIYETFGKDSTIRTNVDESNFKITGGDKIQIELDDATNALKTALLLKQPSTKSLCKMTGNHQ